MVHYLKQKIYINKYNSLMSTQSDLFGRRIKEHIAKVKEAGKKITLTNCEYVR